MSDDEVLILSSSPAPIRARRVSFDSDIEVISTGTFQSNNLKKPVNTTGSKHGTRKPGSTATQVTPGSSKKTEEQRNVAGMIVRASGSGRVEMAPQQQAVPVEDPMTAALACILEVVPNVEPTHALNLLNRALLALEQPNVDIAVAQVAHALFEDPNYPEVETSKGKRKAVEEVERAQKKVKLDYGSKDRPFAGGLDYYELALERLSTDFPYVPKPFIRQRLAGNNMLYAPSYLALEADSKLQRPPFSRKQNPYRPKGKGAAIPLDPELEKEIAWIQEKLQEDKLREDGAVAEKLNEEEYELNGDGIECGCCFTDYPFDKMIQCPDTHLFCKDCMTQYASTQLGEHNPHIVCMSSSDPPCKLPFTFSELERFMTPKLLELYHRVKQRKDIEAAGLEGLEECPFCEYKVVIENPDERLFRCENVEICGVVSCRKCKKPDHLPKTCEEADLEKHLDGQHAVDEAMSKALMRNCPKCKKAFIKESGCNKMTCPSCGTLSCYTCRQVITGYEHYKDSGRPDGPGQKGPRTCVLHDAVEQRAGVEIEAAAKRALQEYKEQHPDMPEEAIKIDINGIPGAGGQALALPQLGGRPQLLQRPQQVVQGAAQHHFHHHHHHHAPLGGLAQRFAFPGLDFFRPQAAARPDAVDPFVIPYRMGADGRYYPHPR